MRGEHEPETHITASAWGSSPHARGTRNSTTAHSVCAGIIPACAGNTARLNNSMRFLKDHPRMRGEHMTNSRIP